VKKFLPLLPYVLVGALILLGLTFLDRACNSTAALVKAKADYAELQRITDADHAMSLDRIAADEVALAALQGRVDTAQVVIDARDTTIAALRGKVTTTDAENNRLRTEVQPVIDANPALAEFVASLDAGIALRNALLVEQDTQIKDLKEQGRLKDERFAVQVELTEEWKANYEREHALRIQAEGLFKVAEHAVKISEFWAAVGKYGPPVTFIAGIICGK